MAFKMVCYDMVDKVEKKFRQIITRFGQLPLLFLVIIGYAFNVYLLHWGSVVNRIDNTAMDIAQFLFVPDVAGNKSFVAMLERWPNAAALLAISLFFSYLFGSFIKLIYFKERPNEQKYNNAFQKIDASSFPSIHTSNSFIVAFFGVYILSLIHI